MGSACHRLRRSTMGGRVTTVPHRSIPCHHRVAPFHIVSPPCCTVPYRVTTVSYRVILEQKAYHFCENNLAFTLRINITSMCEKPGLSPEGSKKFFCIVNFNKKIRIFFAPIFFRVKIFSCSKA